MYAVIKYEGTGAGSVKGVYAKLSEAWLAVESGYYIKVVA